MRILWWKPGLRRGWAEETVAVAKAKAFIKAIEAATAARDVLNLVSLAAQEERESMHKLS